MPDDPDVSMKEAVSRKFLGGSRIRIFLWGDPRGAEKSPWGILPSITLATNLDSNGLKIWISPWKVEMLIYYTIAVVVQKDGGLT